MPEVKRVQSSQRLNATPAGGGATPARRPLRPRPLLTPTKWEMLRVPGRAALPVPAPAGAAVLPGASGGTSPRGAPGGTCGRCSTRGWWTCCRSPGRRWPRWTRRTTPRCCTARRPTSTRPTREGLRLLVRAGRAGEDVAEAPAPAYGPRNALFLAHELPVRDVRVWLEECARMDEHAVERWEDGEAAAIPLDGPAAPRFVRPDAWFA